MSHQVDDRAVPRGRVGSRPFARLLAAVVGAACAAALLAAAPVAATAAPAPDEPDARAAEVVEAPAIQDAMLTRPGTRFVPDGPTRVMPARRVAERSATVLSLTGVPAGATAVALNVTAARATAATWVSVCPGGTPVASCRTTSTLNVTAGRDVANHVVVRLGGPDGNQVLLWNQAGGIDLIADLQGWYVPEGATLQPAGPTRVMSARPVAGGAATVLTLSGVPAGATAVALNVTAARATAATWISVCPGGTPLSTCRTTSTLNVTAGHDVANHVVVRLGGPDGNQVVLRNQAGTAALIADLQGWYVPQGSSLQPAGPARVMTARSVEGGTATLLTLLDVPVGATAVALNVTAARAITGTWVSVCPGGTPVATCRTTSSLNVGAGQDVANHVVVRLGGPDRDQVLLYNQAGNAELIADLQGWYTDLTTTDLEVDGDRLRIRSELGGTVQVRFGQLEPGREIGLHAERRGSAAAPSAALVRGGDLWAHVLLSPTSTFTTQGLPDAYTMTATLPAGTDVVLTASSSVRTVLDADGTGTAPAGRPGQVVVADVGAVPAGGWFDVRVVRGGTSVEPGVVGPGGAWAVRQSRHPLAPRLFVAPATGTYQARVVSDGVTGISIRAVLPLALGALVVDGPAVQVPQLAQGQTAVAPITGVLAAGTVLDVSLPYPTLSTAAQLLDHTGAVRASLGFQGGSVDVLTVPSTGVYSLRVIDVGGAPLTISATTPVTTRPVVVDSASLTLPDVSHRRAAVVPVEGVTGGRTGIWVEHPGGALSVVVEGATVAAVHGGGSGTWVVLEGAAPQARLLLRRWNGTGPVVVDATTPLRDTLVVDGAAGTPGTPRPGQEVLLEVPAAGHDRLVDLQVDGAWSTTVMEPSGRVVADLPQWSWPHALRLQVPAGRAHVVRLGAPGGWTTPPVVHASSPLEVQLDVEQGVLRVPGTRPGQSVVLDVRGLAPDVAQLLLVRRPDGTQTVGADVRLPDGSPVASDWLTPVTDGLRLHGPPGGRVLLTMTPQGDDPVGPFEAWAERVP